MKRFLLLAFIIATTFTSCQQQKLVELTLSNGDLLRVEAVSPSVIKVTMAQSDSLLNIKSLIVEEPTANNFKCSLTKDDHHVILRTDELMVRINALNGDISYHKPTGESLLKECNKALTPYNDEYVGDQFKIKQSLVWDDDEVIYGLGQQQKESINMRGQHIVLNQQNTRISIPVILSTKGYGLYWDNYSRTVYDDKSSDNCTITSDVADHLRYYFVKGDKFDNIISELRELTGRSPMLPRWAFGYFQSRNRYKSREILMDVVKKHRELGIPLDAIILDYLHWAPGAGFGSMSFDEDKFPQPEQMIEELHDKYNCKLLVSVWSSIAKGNDNWRKFNEKKWLLGWRQGDFGSYYDAFNPEAGKLYWSLVKSSYWDKGVDGVWFDATEPEGLNQFKKAKCAMGSAAKYFNLYSYYAMKNIYDNQRPVDSARVFILTRSAFLGQQKYGTTLWSGDIATTFDALKCQIPTGLNLCMSGLPYWNSDIGGYYKGDPNDKSYQELFVRWFQYGAFTPMFRPHGRRVPHETRDGHNELWSYGEDNQEILTSYVRLRYRLLPYIYTLSHKVTSEHYTMMRSLAFDFLEDAAVYEISDQFMFGSNIMVAPITQAKATSREVYLPKGCDWYDFRDGKQYAGGTTIEADAPIEWMPLYVCSGTILPLAEVMEYSNQRKLDDIEIRVYGGRDGEFTMYEDEGDNYNYEDGKFTEIKFTYDNSAKKLHIGARQGEFDSALSSRTFRVVLVNTTQGFGIEETPREQSIKVNYDGNAMEVNL
ncbi:MAG: TIM-barrel domain-containing protein [Rikenellaceae bacterium]